jgi:hypothetical protein
MIIAKVEVDIEVLVIFLCSMLEHLTLFIPVLGFIISIIIMENIKYSGPGCTITYDILYLTEFRTSFLPHSYFMYLDLGLHFYQWLVGLDFSLKRRYNSMEYMSYICSNILGIYSFAVLDLIPLNIKLFINMVHLCYWWTHSWPFLLIWYKLHDIIEKMNLYAFLLKILWSKYFWLKLWQRIVGLIWFRYRLSINTVLHHMWINFLSLHTCRDGRLHTESKVVVICFTRYFSWSL